MVTFSIASRLKAALQAVVPIVDVSLGSEADKTTWRVYPEALQAQAQPIIDAFTLPTAAQVLDEDAQRDVNDKKLMAVALALWEAIPNPSLTKAQMKQRAIAIYKTL
jgi:hypothetical protein